MTVLELILGVLFLAFGIMTFSIQSWAIYTLFKESHIFAKPQRIKTYYHYFLYLIFSLDGRINNIDFMRGLLFWIFACIVAASYILVIGLTFGLAESLFVEVFGRLLITHDGFILSRNIVYTFYFLFVLLTFINLVAKRLKDLNTSGADAIFIFLLCSVASFFYLSGFIGLILYCSLSKGSIADNIYGKHVDLYNFVKNREARLTGLAKKSLENNNFESAISYYTKLEDYATVEQIKKKHLIHILSVLNLQLDRMNEKNIISNNIQNTRDKLKEELSSEMGLSEKEVSQIYEDTISYVEPTYISFEPAIEPEYEILRMEEDDYAPKTFTEFSNEEEE